MNLTMNKTKELETICKIEKLAIIKQFPKDKHHIIIKEYHDYFNNKLINGSNKLEAYRETSRYIEEKLINLEKKNDGWSITIWCKQLNIDKENNWSRCLYRDGGLGLYAWVDDLAYSFSDGRVIFSRGLK